MLISASKSLARLLLPIGSDDDDMFVAKAIHPARIDAGPSRDAGASGTPALHIDGGGPGLSGKDIVLLRYHASAGARISADQGPQIVLDDGSADGTTGDEDTGPDDAGDPAPAPDASGDGEGDFDPTANDGATPPASVVLTGGAGDEVLTGGDAADIFVFAPHGGYDVVSNFEVEQDQLDLRAFGLGAGADILSHATLAGQDLALVFGDTTIVLHAVTFQQAADLIVLF